MGRGGGTYVPSWEELIPHFLLCFRFFQSFIVVIHPSNGLH